ncbi:hypothetical protein [Kitasatospora sp. DSM 101779]|uniref:hypothetical protein n=1 Tax=Kitasatospora sp. DSM 101779 TaxID=2853165 RepID=UPI0021D998E6|nr:hypothetical protein [Kitasatospora sp. DSM 101779]MCU7826032.1 hypothetical protein [Kitasatospora sp. DSM 101779]
MSDMHQRMNDKTERDEEDVRSRDPEEGITSYQTAHAQDESTAEGDRLDEPSEELGR